MWRVENAGNGELYGEYPDTIPHDPRASGREMAESVAEFLSQQFPGVVVRHTDNDQHYLHPERDRVESPVLEAA